MQPERGIEGTRPPADGKKEPGGLFFSVRVPPCRNVYRGCCRFDPYGNIKSFLPKIQPPQNRVHRCTVPRGLFVILSVVFLNVSPDVLRHGGQGVGSGGGQLCAAAETPADARTLKAGVVAGQDIDIGIAYVERGRRVGA